MASPVIQAAKDPKAKMQEAIKICDEAVADVQAVIQKVEEESIYHSTIVVDNVDKVEENNGPATPEMAQEDHGETIKTEEVESPS